MVTEKGNKEGEREIAEEGGHVVPSVCVCVYQGLG